MPCYHPITAWRSGSVNPSGRRSLLFSPEGAFGDALQISCGKCVGCRLERSRQWALRCVHEASLYPENCFVTLTYSEEHLPDPPQLVKRHVQLFFKRLRKRFGKLRYVMCGEYGEKLTRPHYHALIFGMDFPDKKKHTERAGITTFKSQILEDIWGLGFCTLGAISFESAAYVARYSMKKINGDQAKSHYERIDASTGELIQLQPEYLAMSLKPGIAHDWFQKYKSDCYPDDFCISKGNKLRVPAYYDRQLPELELQELKLRRKKTALRFRENSTPTRLAVRETVKLAQLSRLATRNIEK
ncbi:MAG: replication initiator protein [Microvirus sp.]|nr:MAG: replication initiator protein [Microvirus sp.]